MASAKLQSYDLIQLPNFDNNGNEAAAVGQPLEHQSMLNLWLVRAACPAAHAVAGPVACASESARSGLLGVDPVDALGVDFPALPLQHTVSRR
jgi:hypothetical protein